MLTKCNLIHFTNCFLSNRDRRCLQTYTLWNTNYALTITTKVIFIVFTFKVWWLWNSSDLFVKVDDDNHFVFKTNTSFTFKWSNFKSHCLYKKLVCIVSIVLSLCFSISLYLSVSVSVSVSFSISLSLLLCLSPPASVSVFICLYLSATVLSLFASVCIFLSVSLSSSPLHFSLNVRKYLNRTSIF